MKRKMDPAVEAAFNKSVTVAYNKFAAKLASGYRKAVKDDPTLLSDIESHLSDGHNCALCTSLSKRLNGVGKRRR